LADNWVTAALGLDRPEYSKQTEALLTDLLWRSPGSTLYDCALAGRKTPDGQVLDRVVFERVSKASQKVVESSPLARSADLSGTIGGPATAECLGALLNALRAPRSRSYKSISAVPVHPDLIVLQTLSGIVNKENPPNLAKIIEQVGRLGGSDGVGAVAHAFLSGFATPPPIRDGLSGCTAATHSIIGGTVWDRLGLMAAPTTPWPAWPSVRARVYDKDGEQPILAALPKTPFKWFWNKWRVLCDPQRGWLSHLPERRWLDWALALLRAALAFGYLWEAELYVRLFERVLERHAGVDGPARERLVGFLGGQFTLAVVHPRQLPPSQKRMWAALGTNVATGYLFRKRLMDLFDADSTAAPPVHDPGQTIPQWLDALSPDRLSELAAPMSITASTATNTKEFIKYLMLQRSADDDSSDQADLYYLARSQHTNTWVEMGPEWLVVETALLAGRPGRSCTLKLLLDDLAFLGLSIDRSTLVGLLEDTGLSADSPDADDALVIESGF
jgi:hypothetical protein